LDGRTYEAKLYNEFRADLITHVGGTPSIPQAAIIERCAWLKVRIALMDTKVAQGGMTEQDSRVYLAWVGLMGRLLTRLGEPASERQIDALEYARMLAAEERAAASDEAA